MLSAIKQLKNQICNSLKNEKWTKRNETKLTRIRGRKWKNEWVINATWTALLLLLCACLIWDCQIIFNYKQINAKESTQSRANNDPRQGPQLVYLCICFCFSFGLVKGAEWLIICQGIKSNIWELSQTHTHTKRHTHTERQRLEMVLGLSLSLFGAYLSIRNHEMQIKMT